MKKVIPRSGSPGLPPSRISIALSAFGIGSYQKQSQVKFDNMLETARTDELETQAALTKSANVLGKIDPKFSPGKG